MGPTKEAMGALAHFGRVFSAPGFSAGRWADDGPYFEQAPELSDFVQAAYEGGFILRDFDWPAWAEVGKQIEADPARLAEADLDTVQKLLTCHIRSERFSEGHLSGAIADGRLVRLLARLAMLAS